MNKTYSILLRCRVSEAPYYQRLVDGTLNLGETSPAGVALVSPSSDKSYENYQAEQLIRICRKSSLKGLLEAFDTMNTYGDDFDDIEPLTAMETLPDGTTMTLLEADYRHEWVSKDFALTVDPSSGVCLVDGESVEFETTDALTSPVRLTEGLSVVFGNPPAARFQTSVSVVRQPSRDLRTLMTTLETLPVKWLEKYKPYRDSLNPDDRLAAHVLNHCERTLK